MSELIDLHNHLIPGVDDGAQSLEEARAMLEIAYAGGTRQMVITPHFQPGRFNTEAEEIRDKLEVLRAQAREISPEFRLFSGNEIYYFQDAVEYLNAGRILTLADSSYVLVEFSTGVDFRRMRAGLQDFVLNGYRPVLAHAERYGCLVKSTGLVEELIEMGVYVQLNASSIVGKGGLSVKSFCKKLLKWNCVHFIGSDGHRSDWRKPELGAAATYIEHKFGSDIRQDLFYENPMKVIRHESI